MANAARVVALVPLALLAGALGIWAIDPGYEAHPLLGVLALGFAAAAAGVARGARWRLALAAALVIAGGAALYSWAPTGIDRRSYTAVERAWLAAAPPYPGSTSTPPHTEPASGSDFGIDFLNPPETYDTSRTDTLPDGVTATRAADFYERELRRASLTVDRFRLQLPGRSIEVDGQRGPVDVEVTLGSGAAELVAHCERNGPFDRSELEPPCVMPT